MLQKQKKAEKTIMDLERQQPKAMSEPWLNPGSEMEKLWSTIWGDNRENMNTYFY